jgi:transcription termination/antitermination protein NusG
MSSPIEDGMWIAVQVRPRMENEVAEGLSNRGYGCFLPLCCRPHQARKALFPGYLFCRYIRTPTFRIVEVPGVLRLVGAAGQPTPISETEIESIRLIVGSGYYSEPWKFLETGQRVVVRNGSLRGIEGIVVASRKKRKLIVSVPLLRRAVSVEIRWH